MVYGDDIDLLTRKDWINFGISRERFLEDVLRYFGISDQSGETENLKAQKIYGSYQYTWHNERVVP